MENKIKKLTIKEIAKKSGFSKSTVSRVLLKSNKVKRETKGKILKIIKDLEYEPNVIARSLRTKRTNTIGLILGDIENPFYSRVARGVLDAAENNDYNVILCNSSYDMKLEEKSIKALLSRQVDGFLITTVKLRKNTIDILQGKKIPFVLIDYKLDMPGISYVVNDDYYGGKIVGEYLVGLGHKKIGFLGNRKLLSFSSRYNGFKDVLKKNNLSNDWDFIVNDINDVVEIKTAIRGIINNKERITSIFAVNDFLAIKTVDNLISIGLKVPRDISVIGYDNINISSMLRVPLTTINQPKYRTGKLATKHLLNILEGKIEKPVRIVLKPELIIRQSCIEI